MRFAFRIGGQGAKSVRAMIFLAPIVQFAFAAPVSDAFDTLHGQRGAGVLGRDAVPTADGGSIFIGVRAGTAHDVQALKLDSSGSVMWQRSYAVVSQPTDGYRIAQTSTGYVVAGVEGTATDPAALMVMNLDASGNPLWQASYSGGSGGLGVLPNSIDSTSDGGYVVGAIDYDSHVGGVPPLWVVKLDGSGAVEWQKVLGFITGSVHPSADGGYIVAGTAPCTPKCTPWVVKLDSAGSTVWQKQYVIGDTTGFAQSARQTADGGYLVAGGYQPSADINNGWLMKIDAQGEPVWQQGYSSAYCFAGVDVFDTQLTDSGGYLLMFNSPCVGAEQGVAMLNADGTIQWQESPFYPTGKPSMTIVAFAPTPDGGFVATGEVGSKLLAMKADSQGSLGSCPNIALQSPQLSLVSPPATQAMAGRIAMETTRSVPAFRQVRSSSTNLSSSNACDP